MPRSLCDFLGRVLGNFAWLVVPAKRKKMAVGQVKMCLGVDEAEAVRIAKASTVRFGPMLFEVLRFPVIKKHAADYVRIEGLEKLQQSHFHEVHIELFPVIKNEYQLTELREMLYDSTGNCKVFLHINLPEGNYVVEANSMLLVEPTKELCQRIKNLIYVKDCWFQ